MIPLNDMHNFYGGLPEVVRSAIDAASTFHEMPENSVLMREGERHDRLYQIVRGEVKVSSSSRDGRETVIALIRDGDWVAVSEMFSDLPANANVVAISPVRVRAIGRSSLRVLINRHPEVAEQLLRVLSQRVSLLCRIVVDRSVLALKERVVKTLYLQAFSHGLLSRSQNNVVIALSQEELSKLLMASRQTLNKVLKELEREGLLQISYGGICLLGLEPIRQRYGYLIDVDEPAAVYRD